MVERFKLKTVVRNRIASIIRLIIITSTAFAAATFANWIDYQNYWQGTMFRTQTVDFNILAHTLPTKLSYSLQKGDIPELQRTLDSNYGLFGLVVTDCQTTEKSCPNQKILYLSTSNRRWKTQLKLEDLSLHPYDLLRNPPPLFVESKYDNPDAKERTTTGRSNQGEIIARVYYIRTVPPRFAEDFLLWIKNPWSVKGLHKHYLLNASLFLIGSFATFIVLEFVIYRRRKSQEQLQQEVRILQYQLSEQERQNYYFELEKRQLNAEIEQQKTEIEQQNQEHEYLHNQLLELQAQREISENKVAELEQQLSLVDTERENNEQIANQLESQLAQLQAEREQDEQVAVELQNQLALIQAEKENATEQFTLLENQLIEVQAQREIDIQTVAQLERQLTEVQTQRERATDQFNQLESQLLEVHKQREIDVKTVAQLETRLAEVQAQRERTKQQFRQLQSQLEEIQAEREIDIQTVTHLENQLIEIQAQRQTDIQIVSQLESQLAEVQLQTESAEIVVKQLQNELDSRTAEYKQETDGFQRQLESLQNQIGVLESQLSQERRDKQRYKLKLSQVNEELEKYTNQKQLDNNFEKQVEAYIKSRSHQRWDKWRILPSFDVSYGRQATQFVDLIVILNSYCVVVIEAKRYLGKIQAKGDAKNNEWVCHNSEGLIPIQSAGMENPYHQIVKYTKNISMKLETYTRKYRCQRITVYGLIVFPEKADISALGDDFGTYYLVETLDNLGNLLTEIEQEHKSSFSNNRLLSNRQIEDVLRGILR
ncbi:MAG: NERD domain-containing protein [Nostocaceae cyanobacterium]|nr:NERD domain-containing protein [Nostocaceae cyanobacterium]